MKSKYIEDIDCGSTLPSKSVQAYSPQLSNTAMTKVMTAALFVIGSYAITANDVRDNNTQVETTVSNIKQANINYPITSTKPDEATDLSLITESQELQRSFGFKTAQWAAVLQVERKTLYNWAKNPETKIQAKVAKRLKAFKVLLDDMDTGHAQFLASFAFGRYRKAEFSDYLITKNISSEKMIDLYENLYSEFDGKYKRLKHKQSKYA